MDKFIELSPAKINLFLKFVSKRPDNYFNIRSGVTLINLFDKINVIQKSSFGIFYVGRFAPVNNLYDDCILNKLFKLFEIKKPNMRFIIEKNIPVQAGLGSASTNAAAMFRLLEKLNIFKINNFKDAKVLGSDVPLFLNQKDCLIRGIGEKITNKKYPKYFFLLVKPNSNCSTKKMYSLITNNHIDYNLINENTAINEFDIENDFEKIVGKINAEVVNILNYLNNLENVKFSRMTGSGSCCYAAFDSKYAAEKAQKKINQRFPQYWNFIAENNLLN